MESLPPPALFPGSPVIITSKFAGSCAACSAVYAAGDRIDWERDSPGARCIACSESGRRAVPPPDDHELYCAALASGLPERAERVQRLVADGKTELAGPLGLQLGIDIAVCFAAGYSLEPPESR